MALPLVLAVTLALGATPAASPPIKLAATTLEATNVAANVARFSTEQLATELGTLGLQVVTPQEIGTVLGFERQKQLLGCADDTESCMAELGGALGVDGVMLGNVARLGTVFQLTVRVISPGGKRLAASSQRSATEEGLLDAISAAARELAAQLGVALGRTPTQAPAAAVTGSGEGAGQGARIRRFGARVWAPATGGVLLLGGGAVLGLMAKDRHQTLTATEGPPIADAEARRLAKEERDFQRFGVVSGALGAAALGVATYLYLRGEPATPVALVPSAEGAALVLGGRFR